MVQKMALPQKKQDLPLSVFGDVVDRYFPRQEKEYILDIFTAGKKQVFFRYILDMSGI